MLTSLRRWITPQASPALAEPNLHGHIPALDALRGLAILVVTLYRFGGGSPEPASVGEKVIPLIELGVRGVDLFFVLSGFLITGILLDCKHKRRYFTNFYARRTVRIFPLYYAVLIVTLVVLPLLGRGQAFAPAQEHGLWLWLYGANILQSIRGEWCLGWLNHLWSLAVEEHFYLIWPAVIYCLSAKNAKRVCAALFLAAPVARAVWLLCGGNAVATEVLTLLRVDGLVAGAWLALVAREGGVLRMVPMARIVFAVTTLVLIPLSLAHLRLLTLVDTLWVIECSAFLVLMVAAQNGSALNRVASSQSLHWLGKYSYGIYMLGNLLIPLVAGIVSAPRLAESLGPMAGQVAYMLLMIPITLLAAITSWHLFEKPWVRLKRYFGG